MPKNPYRTIDYWCAHLFFDTFRSEYGGAINANRTQFRSEQYHRPLQFSPDHNVIYEELQEEIGLWLTNVPEWMKQSATMF